MTRAKGSSRPGEGASLQSRREAHVRMPLVLLLGCLALLPFHAGAQTIVSNSAPFQAVPQLPYRVVTNFFKLPKGAIAGESSGVAVNSKGHIYLFQRTKPMLAEYDEKGNFV